MGNRLNKNNSGTGITHFIQALGWSIKGFGSAFKHEAAFRQELILFCILAPLAFRAGHNGVERTLLLGSMFLVLVVELLNTAVESVVDRISQDIHPLSGRAKELGSAAVCISLLNAACTWGLILFT
ncbi:MAG TPA: diacylglycerol kinase [Desulfobulbaceae bacterium]|nr:diacylglycerol kinase [Desulfobulbaceae bacterium]HHD63187.1 diacylglycerol kinase [Desulfobulbaceae bacterium]